MVYVYQACKLAIRESIEAEIRKERERQANPDAVMDVSISTYVLWEGIECHICVCCVYNVV